MAGFDDPNAIELTPATGPGLDLDDRAAELAPDAIPLGPGPGTLPGPGPDAVLPGPGSGAPAGLTPDLAPRGPGSAFSGGFVETGPRGPRPRPTTPAQATLPPLVSALYKALKEGRSGTVTAVLPEGERASVTVTAGRVTSVAHPATSSTAMIEVLTRIGLICERDVRAAERLARRKGMLLEDAIVASGQVSAGTLQNVREMLCREVMLDLLPRREIQVTAVWTVLKGVRETCVLPVPFLLKEAQRRARELPEVRRVVASYPWVFGRTQQGGRPMRWEDLRLPAAERQVYFFVDGHRTVTELADATCQSEFEVARALRALVEAGLVERVEPGRGTGPGRRPRGGSATRTGTLLLAAVGLAIAVTFGLRWSTVTPPVAEPDREAFVDSVRRASSARVAAAMRLYDLSHGQPAASFRDLLDNHMVLPGDQRAAVTLFGGALPGDEGAPPVPEASAPAEVDGKNDR